MSDGYCQKHFIRYCPDLSANCPYCRWAELEAENERLVIENAQLMKSMATDQLAAEAKLEAILVELWTRCATVPAIALRKNLDMLGDDDAWWHRSADVFGILAKHGYDTEKLKALQEQDEINA